MPHRRRAVGRPPVPAASSIPRAVPLSARWLLLAGLAAFAGCPRPSRPTPKFLGDARQLDASDVDPAYREDWAAMEKARAADPASPEVAELATKLLQRDPPLPVRLSALRARAEHAYAHGDDAATIAAGDEGLGLVEVAGDRAAAVLVDLARLRAFALARGGDPQAALAALDGPILAGTDRLTLEQRWGARAAALDRDAQYGPATVAYAQWRQVLDGSDPAATWAEHRMSQLATSLDEAAWTELLPGVPASAARTCLGALHGERLPEGEVVPDWVARCASGGGKVGVLLPRTGKLSALADVQLAAAVTAIEVLGPEVGVDRVVFADAGSTAASARAGAIGLVGQGVDVVVGPVGAANVTAVVEALDGTAAVIVPSESSGKAIGVAPSLERRIARLVAHAKAAGKERIIIVAPDNGYGKRAIKAAEAKARGFAKKTVVATYPSNTTSFKPVLTPIMTALSSDAALLVADHLPRTEAIVRQLLRAGKVPARGDSSGLFVLATAEGTDPALVAASPDVFEGVWASPVAAIDEPTRAFADAYAARQGELPSDQALLVFHAMRRALASSASALETEAPLVRFSEGMIVGEASTAQ